MYKYFFVQDALQEKEEIATVQQGRLYSNRRRFQITGGCYGRFKLPRFAPSEISFHFLISLT
jgi:hypothetical protein